MSEQQDPREKTHGDDDTFEVEPFNWDIDFEAVSKTTNQPSEMQYETCEDVYLSAIDSKDTFTATVGPYSGEVRGGLLLAVKGEEATDFKASQDTTVIPAAVVVQLVGSGSVLQGMAGYMLAASETINDLTGRDMHDVCIDFTWKNEAANVYGGLNLLSTGNIPQCAVELKPDGLYLLFPAFTLTLQSQKYAKWYATTPQSEHTATEVYKAHVLVTPYKDSAPEKKPKRYDGIERIQPSNTKYHMPSHNNLSNLMLDTAVSIPKMWERADDISGYYLTTENGTVQLRNVPNDDMLTAIINKFGPTGLRVSLALLALMGDTIRRKYKTMPAYTELTPMTYLITDLLRAIKKTPKGNSFSRNQQMELRDYIMAQSKIDYASITPTTKGHAKLSLGPIINILSTDVELSLPYDDLYIENQLISVMLLPGKHIYEQHMTGGVPWFHQKLLTYNERQDYEMLIGYYINQMQKNRRNKLGQDWISIGSIEQGSRIYTLRQSNELHRLKRAIQALDRLASDGLIPGEADTSPGKIKALYKLDTVGKKMSAAGSIRATQVRICYPETLPNGYTPLMKEEQSPVVRQISKRTKSHTK